MSNDPKPPKGPAGKPPRKPRLAKGMTVGDYAVGKGKTDTRTWWKKGGPSPNPKGRPRKAKIGKRDLDFFLEERVAMPNAQVYTKRELGYMQLANHYAKGTPWALKLIGVSDVKSAAASDPLLIDEELTRAILEEALRELAENREPLDPTDGPAGGEGLR
jgi:hypothetical protein